MKTMLTILTLLTSPLAQAASTAWIYDCEIRGATNISAKLELYWEIEPDPFFQDSTPSGQGILTLHTSDGPVFDPVTVSLPPFSKSGYLRGQKFSGQLREPYSQWDFGGPFWGLGSGQHSISCSKKGA